MGNTENKTPELSETADIESLEENSDRCVFSPNNFLIGIGSFIVVGSLLIIWSNGAVIYK